MTHVSTRHGLAALLLTLIMAVIAVATVFGPVHGATKLERIMVELNVRFVPEGYLPSHADASGQRAKISAIQEEVLALLDGTEHEITARFKTIPYITVMASPDAIIRLRRSNHVVRTTPARDFRPSLSGSVPQI